MSRFRLLAGFFFLVLMVPALSAQEKSTIKWKFEKDKVFYQKMVTKTTQKMKVMGQDINQEQNQTFFFSWTPMKQDGDNWELKQKIEGVILNIDIGGTKVQYDSTKESASTSPLSDFFKALIGTEFTITLNTKDMKVVKIGGREEFVKKLVNSNPQMQPLLDKVLNEKAMIEMAEPTFGAIPNTEAIKGDKDKGTWKRSTSLDMGPIGKYDNTYTYTYDGADEKKMDKISVKSELNYTKPVDSNVGGLPFKIESANLKTSSSQGLILFDPVKGRIDRSSMSLKLAGDLTIDIGGQKTKVELEQSQETGVETSDTNPIPAKPK
ncbi:MAG: hypothetical protein EXR99_01135 [Gemmataceae bacterium]|nr:hypothetical protein [Gemmataceae bacterium]